MKRINVGDPEMQSADVAGDNIDQLKRLFPESFSEGKVNFEVLRQLLGGAVEDSDEKYGLSWHGKRQARQLALTPSPGTLRPCPDESVDWDNTRNLVIEGDNLEVLKLLQKSYAGKVKLIYIDPPYNRDADVVYTDDFRDGLNHYRMVTGQIDSDGRALTTARDSSGRLHTNWLNMMFPRLCVARTLLRQDGVAFISIDDTEVAQLRLVLDEVFGPENFIAEVIWEGANKNDARQIGVCHEYVIVYAKSREGVERNWGLDKEGVDSVLKEVKRLQRVHGEDYGAASDDLAGWFRANKAKPAFANRRFRNIDARGAYKEDDPTAPGGRKFDLRNPRDGGLIPLRKNRGWGFDQETFDRLVEEDRVTFVSESSVMIRRYLHETDKLTPPSVIYQPARSASERLTGLMNAQVFDYPKDENIIAKFVQMATESDPGALVLDFFAGSGTTGHAVMLWNVMSGGQCRYILVQLPEQLDRTRSDQKSAADFCIALEKPANIAELTKERLRRSANKIKSVHPDFRGDLGFRSFKLDTSSVTAWNPMPEEIEESLLEGLNHIKADRTDQDVLTELLLKLGLDLCVPVETRTIAAKLVHAVGAGTLIACLSDAISLEETEPLGQGIAEWHQLLAPATETTVVFRDSAFADDVAKTNLTAILHQQGIGNVRSL